MLECHDQDCPCKSEGNLYDASTGKFSKAGSSIHKDLTFLKHFNKRLYEEALSKFTSSALLHVSFSCFLFSEMKNVHAALLELNLAGKQKQSLKLQFMVYRQRATIEEFVRAEATRQKDAYNQLVNIIEFERLHEECQKAIEREANLQIDFWAQVANQMPDLNILHDMVNKIFTAVAEVEEIWKRLCEINPSHSKSMSLYGNYLIEIRNNGLAGYELLEK